MSLLHVKYLLAGAGLAASSAARAIRQRDPRGALMMVGVEKLQPYHRPPLSREYLTQRRQKHELFAMPTSWFADQHIQLRTGARASHLDTARGVLTLESGEGISFDSLLLATGASPVHLRIAGANFPNVHYLRTADEADRLHNAIEKARAEGARHDRGRGYVAVIGAGLLGVELAGTLTELGLAVDLIASKSHPWPRIAGDHTGALLARYLQSHGVTIHTHATPQRLDGDGRAQRVVIDDDRTIPCDFVIVAAGAVANRDLLRGTPINAEKAILADDHCRTNVPNIYAAGDCAAIFDPLFGKHRILDHFESAAVTGAIAGANMAGADERYAAVNHFTSQVFDLKLSGWGEPRLVDRRLVRESAVRPRDAATDAPQLIEFGIAADGRIAQVLAINHAAEDDTLASLIAQRIAIQGTEESLKDPAFSLQSLLA